MLDYLLNSTQGLTLLHILLIAIYAVVLYLLIHIKLIKNLINKTLLHKIIAVILAVFFIKFYCGTKNIISSRIISIRVAQSFGICKTKICKIEHSLNKKERRKVEKLNYGISDILKN